MPQISKLVRDALQAQLSDQTLGFNPSFANVANDYGVPVIEIDWSGKTNWMFGRIDPSILEQVGPISYPFLTIDTGGAEDTGMIVSATFGGTVTAIIEIHLSWAQMQRLPDFASYADAVEDSMFSTMNNQSNQPWGSTGILYSGHMAFVKSPIVMAAQNWRQTLRFMPRMRAVA